MDAAQVAHRRLAELSLDNPWPVYRSVDVALQLARLVRALHEADRWHGEIRLETIELAGDRTVRLCDAAGERVFGGNRSELELCPPELLADEELPLPLRLRDAAAQLESHGQTIDPRRIDVYQIGVVLCQLITGAPIQRYAESARVKATVPGEVRGLLDGTLGFDSAERVLTCHALCDLLEQALQRLTHMDSGLHVDTPRPLSLDTDASVLGGPASQPAATGDLPFAHLAHFRLLEQIGRGGMGEVYRAHDEKLNRIVAVKLLRSDLGNDESFARRFQTEVDAIKQLPHPNLLPLYFTGVDHGRRFYVMRYVDGPSLAARLRTAPPLDVQQAIDIALQCLSALAVAHDDGVIHRDIKPANVLLEESTGRAYLVDFGLARRVDDEQGLTRTGVVVGSVEYLSPEQARGGGQVDHRADLYSFGVMFYQMLCGRLPFTADSAVGWIFQHVHEPPTPLGELRGDLPPELCDLVDQLLAKQAEDRPASCSAVIERLQPLQNATQRTSQFTSECSTFLCDEPSATALPTISMPPAGGHGLAGRLRDGMATFVRKHTPDWIKHRQSDEQQIDGEIARQVRRKRRLQALQAQGRELLHELRAQARVFDQHSLAPEARAQLQQQIAEVTEQLATVDLQEAQANADLLRMTSMRDALAARLRLAERRVDNSSLAHTRWLPRAGLVAALVVGIAGTWSAARWLLVSPAEKSVFEEQADPNAPLARPAAAFDGVDDRVDVPSLRPDFARPLTVEAWAQATRRSRGKLLTIAEVPLRQWDDEWQFAMPMSPRDGRQHYVNAMGSAPNVVVGQWQHIAGTWDPARKEITLFVDGKLVARAIVADAEPKLNMPTSIGWSPSFAGQIAAVRVSSSVRYTSAFVPALHFEDDPDTIAVYHFDEGAGDVLRDSSGNNRHGKIVGAKWVRVQVASLTHRQSDPRETPLVVFADPTMALLAGPVAALDARPQSADLLKQRGAWHALRNNWPAARKDWEACLALQPDNAPVRWRLALVCLLLEDELAYRTHCQSLSEYLRSGTNGYSQCSIIRTFTLDSRLATATELNERLDALEADKIADVVRTRTGVWYRDRLYADCIEQAAHFGGDGAHIAHALPWLFRAMALHQLDRTAEAQADLAKFKAFAERQEISSSTGGFFEQQTWPVRLEWFIDDGLRARILYREASRLIRGQSQSLEIPPVDFVKHAEVLGGVKTQSATSTSAASPALDAQVAREVLALGGRVRVQPIGSSSPVLVENAALLPREPYELTSINLSQCTGVSPELLARVGRLRAVVDVNLLSTGVDDAAIEPLGKLTNLCSLGCGDSRVTGECLATFEAMPSMAGISFGGMFEGRNLAHFSKFPNLRAAFLGWTSISDEELKNIPPSSAMRQVYLGRTKISGPGLVHLSRWPNLEDLSLNRTELTDEGLKNLPPLSHLAKLRLDNNDIGDTSAHHLKQYTSLRLLYLKATNFTAAGLAELQAAIPLCTIEHD